MKTLVLLVAPALLFGCQKQADKGGADMTPEPVAKQPSPDPSPAARAKADGEGGSGSAAAMPAPAMPAPESAETQVRPPVAADLAGYVKNVPGTGSKLLAQVDTSMGAIHCELFGDKAPIAVANFVGLATGQKPWLNPSSGGVEQKKPYFDGLTFHRVIAGFMIQGGDPLGAGTGGPGYNFDNEIDRSLKMDPGALAMANTGHPNSNGSQFFIMEGSKPGLLGGYTIFGQCSDPDVVKKITSVKTDGNDKPDQPVTITKVTITKG
ncbi:MAG TPA: peptidylprolyl isomerase [Kofleriaceae bacterium]|jgi:peptidyl-prolyl cis-trans isomerase A (cyclophilin A)|nr:peptidylprolyl isomerase [Kofleriaceae bacterium]